jgi:WD40 repeat protein
MWDALTVAELKTLEVVELKILDGHTDYVQSVAFSSDSTRVVSCSDDKSVRVWDALTGMELKMLIGHTSYI